MNAGWNCLGRFSLGRSFREREALVMDDRVDALLADVERVRRDEDFVARARRLLERDRHILERLAR